MYLRIFYRTYAHSTDSWLTWRLGGLISKAFWRFLRKSCFRYMASFIGVHRCTLSLNTQWLLIPHCYRSPSLLKVDLNKRKFDNGQNPHPLAPLPVLGATVYTQVL